jgi:hypothetical protein
MMEEHSQVSSTTFALLRRRLRLWEIELKALQHLLLGTIRNPLRLILRFFPSNFLPSLLLSLLPPRHQPFILDWTFANYLTAIAAQYGEGVTGKAVSTYFERAKKDPQWNRANSIEENSGSAKKPRAPRTPKAKKEKFEGDADDSPTKPKKTPLNKTQGGRVAKTPGSGRGRPVKNYAEPEDENEDDNEDVNVKGEHDNEADDDDMAVQHANGNGHGMGNNNWSNSGDVYYDPEDEYDGVEG